MAKKAKNVKAKNVVGQLLNLENSVSLKINTDVNLAGIAKLVSVRAKKIYKEMRERQTAALDKARKNLSDVLIEATAAAKQRMADYQFDDNVIQLCKNLENLTGVEYAPYTFSAKCNEKAREVQFQLCICRKQAKPPTSKPYNGVLVETEVSVSFDQGLISLLQKRGEAEAAVKVKQRELSSTLQALAELPDLVEEAEANVLEQQLLGTLQSTGDILAAIQAATPKLLTKE